MLWENREIPDHKACPVSVCRVTYLITGIGTAVPAAVHTASVEMGVIGRE